MPVIPLDIVIALALVALAVGGLVGAVVGFSMPRRRRSISYFLPRVPVDPQPYGEWTPEHGAAVTATRRIS